MSVKTRDLGMTPLDDLFSTDESRAESQLEKVVTLNPAEISDFPNHPFKVKQDEAMAEMVDSIRKYGVLVPALVRPKEDGGYEMVAGHRRKFAAALAELTEIPCIVRNLTDDEATIIMVDSNLQRETILPSEKAFAYKMKLDAMKRQGQRSDLTSDPLGQKLKGKVSVEVLATNSPDGKTQIQRFIRLTELIPSVLQMVDDGKIAFRPAVELSYLSKEQQEEIYNLIANRNFFGVEELLEQADASPELKETFRLLPEFAGDVDVLKKAVEHAPTDQAKQAVGRLLKIYKLLALYGADDYVTFDLSMSGHYGYYTGIVFRAYTYGTGDAIVTGGRYDHLLEKFGKQTPSIGFAIIIDELQNALSRQKITVETGHNNLIVYTDATEKWAIALAKDFREKGKYMELLKRTEEDSKETFIAYGKRTHAVSMLYLNENLTIDMVNLSTGEEKKVNARKKAKARENR